MNFANCLHVYLLSVVYSWSDGVSQCRPATRKHPTIIHLQVTLEASCGKWDWEISMPCDMWRWDSEVQHTDVSSCVQEWVFCLRKTSKDGIEGAPSSVHGEVNRGLQTVQSVTEATNQHQYIHVYASHHSNVSPHFAQQAEILHRNTELYYTASKRILFYCVHTMRDNLMSYQCDFFKPVEKEIMVEDVHVKW